MVELLVALKVVWLAASTVARKVEKKAEKMVDERDA